jgi:hypothetical protein
MKIGFYPVRLARSAADVLQDLNRFGYDWVLSGGLTVNAVALATGHTGWDGLGDGGAHVIVPTARDQRSRLQRSERRYVPWGHWGTYYGPMIAHP